MRCSSLFINTLNDFASCGEYVDGVISGWHRCNTPETWHVGRSDDPFPEDGFQEGDCDHPEFVGGHWEC